MKRITPGLAAIIVRGFAEFKRFSVTFSVIFSVLREPE